MIRVIPVDIHGLNLILGGGVPVLRRYADYDESATLLLRGPPGSGKTVFGTQLAGAVARLLVEGTMFDVVYGCVELLPTELAAQHEGLTPRELPERVVVPPFPEVVEPHTGKECRIYAGLLNLTAGDEQAGIEQAIEALLAKAMTAGGKPRVLVIDSLSDGYNLGSAAPRILADAICKIAVERGLILILLEETIDGKPSAWSFAVDVVMELRQRTGGAAGDLERSVTVLKNRFGPVEPGPHRVSILKGRRFTIRPEPSVYTSSTTEPPFVETIRQKPMERSWGITHFAEAAQANHWPLLTNQTVAVCGPHATFARKRAESIGGPLQPKEVELLVELHQLSENAKNVTRPEDHVPDKKGRLVLGLGYPYLGGDRLVDLIVHALIGLAKHGRIVRVILGDTRGLRLFANPDEMVQSLMILSALLREANIPLILFDGSRLGSILEGLTNDLPLIVDLADVTLVSRFGDPRRMAIRVEATYSSRARLVWSIGADS